MRTLNARASLELTADGGDAVSLWISENCLTTWRITLDALMGRDRFRVGELVTEPHTSTLAQPTRLVAIASVPGVTGWCMRARAEVIASAADRCQLDLATERHHGTYGFEDLEQRAKGSASGVAGAVFLRPWKRKIGWTAWATAPGATVTVMGTVISVPINGSVRDEYSRLLAQQTITCAGTAGYLVSWE